jgi:4-amino-4-deoxy-L-arabinose transferase-like glycosyltransferase
MAASQETQRHRASFGRRPPLPLDAAGARPSAAATALARLRISREARWVWLAVAGFVAMSVWWLGADDRVPDWDSGFHEFYAAVIHNELASGQLTRPFTDYNTYPPLVHLIGALSIFAAGLHPATLILSSNVVFVPLLAFGCFGAARIAYGPRAGVLAAVLALGSPMIVSTMHEYYLDGPQAAMIAVSVWALLASRHFERVGIAALAGALSGLALLTKETSVVFLAGFVFVAALRAGRSGRRGILAYTLAALLVAGPWYIYHAAQISSTYTVIGGLTPSPGQAPPLSSLASFSWYGWNLVNQQLFAPLTVAFAVGSVLALRRLLRRGVGAAGVEPELLAGAFVSYLGMTLLVHKDPRYTLPMLVYVALLATGWIANLSRPRWRALLSAAVLALAAIYFVGISAGVGSAIQFRLPGSRHEITLYDTAGWLRGAPAHDGDVGALLTGLRANGIRDVLLYTGNDPIDFNEAGLRVMVMAAGLHVADAGAYPAAEQASLVLSPPGPAYPPPCQRLNDGSRIYVVAGPALGLDAATLRDRAEPRRRYTLLCPGRRTLLYP